MMRLFRRRSKIVEPIGWDNAAKRVHDVEPIGPYLLLHHSTCWCRQPRGAVQ